MVSVQCQWWGMYVTCMEKLGNLLHKQQKNEFSEIFCC